LDKIARSLFKLEGDLPIARSSSEKITRLCWRKYLTRLVLSGLSKARRSFGSTQMIFLGVIGCRASISLAVSLAEWKKSDKDPDFMVMLILQTPLFLLQIATAMLHNW
jgi:hypothetical protein